MLSADAIAAVPPQFLEPSCRLQPSPPGSESSSRSRFLFRKETPHGKPPPAPTAPLGMGFLSCAACAPGAAGTVPRGRPRLRHHSPRRCGARGLRVLSMEPGRARAHSRPPGLGTGAFPRLPKATGKRGGRVGGLPAHRCRDDGRQLHAVLARGRDLCASPENILKDISTLERAGVTRTPASAAGGGREGACPSWH